MSNPHQDFDLRVRNLNKKRRKAPKSSGPIMVDRDGYVIVRGHGRRRGIPYTGLLVLFAGFIGLKAAMMVQMGTAGYLDKLQEFESAESRVASIGVWTMKPDPVSSFVADQIRDKL